MSTQIKQADAEAFIKDLNPQKIISDKANEILEIQKMSIANERASREPIPGVTAEAFNSDETVIVNTSVGDVKIRKMVIADMTIFKLTDSPFYKLMMGDINVDESDDMLKKLFPDEEYLNSLVYQFTTPVKDVYKLVKKSKEEYYETVTEHVGFIYQPTDILNIVDAIIKHIGMVNSSHVEFKSASGNNQDDKKKQKHL
jgi:hypothetical protein